MKSLLDKVYVMMLRKNQELLIIQTLAFSSMDRMVTSEMNLCKMEQQNRQDLRKGFGKMACIQVS